MALYLRLWYPTLYTLNMDTYIGSYAITITILYITMLSQSLGISLTKERTSIRIITLKNFV